MRDEDVIEGAKKANSLHDLILLLGLSDNSTSYRRVREKVQQLNINTGHWRIYKNYTDVDIVNACKEAKSIAGVLKKLNLVVAGGNYINLKRKIQQLNIDTAHWTGRAWNKGQQLKDWSEYTKKCSIRKHLLKTTKKCNSCNRTKWLGQPIKLEVHHKDGDRTNNNIYNLSIVCPNCHSMTPNFRGRK